MTNDAKTTAALDYPPLPKPFGLIDLSSMDAYSDDQMRAYVDADRAARGDAKRRWMQIADQRAIEVADLKAEVKRLRATAEQSSVGQEPVAWRCWDDDHNSRWSFTVWPHESDKGAVWEPLYTHPAPQPAPVAQGGTTFGLPYGIIDPDYARVYTTARILAWQYGFALTMHGSFTRDLDLVLVPWARNAFNDAVDRIIKMLCEACDLSWDGTCGDKPHGRKAYTLVFKKFSDPRWIDLSVLPVPAPVAQGDALTQAARDVLAERERQINAEGWTPANDDGHEPGSLSEAAGCYAMQAYGSKQLPALWPWAIAWWKPSDDPRRNLEKAGALILAEMERIDRAAARAQAEEGA